MAVPKIGVVGIGTMGSQTLWQLSKRDVEVTGFELYRPGHPRGAAGGENRIMGSIEFEDLRFNAIAERTHELWEELMATTSVPLRDKRGVLTFGEEGHEWTNAALASAERFSDIVEVMSTDEVRQRFPKYNIKDNEVGMFDRDGGLIFPERTVRAATGHALKNGATLHDTSRITKVTQKGQVVTVECEDGSAQDFDKLVVCAGSWTNKLFPELKQFFAMRRLLSAWFQPKFGETMEGIFPYGRAYPNYSYGLNAPDNASIKLGIGFDDHTPISSPDEADSVVTEEELEKVRDVARDLLPTFDDYPVRFGFCHESYTVKRIEWFKPHPEMSNVFIAAGFSGKGFMNSPAMGEAAAIWATDGALPGYASFLADMDHVPYPDGVVI